MSLADGETDVVARERVVEVPLGEMGVADLDGAERQVALPVVVTTARAILRKP